MPNKHAYFSQGLLCILPLDPLLDVHQVVEDVSLQDGAGGEDTRVGGAGDPRADDVLPREEEPLDVRLGPEARLRPRVEARHVVLKPVELPVELGRNSTYFSNIHLERYTLPNS